MYRVDFYRKSENDKDFHMSVFDSETKYLHYEFLKNFQSIDIDKYMKIYFKNGFEIYDLNVMKNLIVVRVELLS